MIREKSVAKDDRFEMYELKDNFATNRIVLYFELREKDN